MRASAIALCALLLAGVSSTASQAQDARPATVTAQGELPRTARPRHYAISITPDAAALTFSGRSQIDLTLLEPGRDIVLNAHKLKIARATLTGPGAARPIPLTVTLDAEREQVRLTAPAALMTGDYRVDLDYTGIINRQPSGLFALDYPDKRTGKSVRSLFTQFEVPDAREFAPLFDEPGFKATFDLSAVVPQGQMAVSNMPLAREDALPGGLKRVTFQTTPKMSSYLLFFGTGDFERMSMRSASGTEVGIVAPSGSGGTARYALDSLAEMIPFYNDYFGTAFPLPKLDNVAAPGSSQSFGAMENWGAIMTFEGSLLLDPRNTSPERLAYLDQAQAHELAHQWFGNLVTMGWWDDLWLNEGFASWFETKANDHFHPERFNLLDRVAGREKAMKLDALSSSHAVVVPIRTAAEADSAFDAISYSKGEAVIAMLEAYAGEDKWRDGVRSYLAAHAYGNAVTADLWRAQEQAGTPGIALIADRFTRQPGVPLVRVNQQCVAGQTRVSLSQDEFTLDRRAGNPARRWLVPLMVRAADGSVHRSVLRDSAQIALPGCGPVIINGGQRGYFRTLYQPAQLAQLTAAMGGLDPIDQMGLVADNLALAASDYQDYAPALALLAAIPAQANPVVAKSAIEAWTSVYGLLAQPSDRARLAKRVHRQWFGRLQHLGYAPRVGESNADAALRATLIQSFGQMGDRQVVSEARKRLAQLRKDRAALDGPLKSTWLAVAARNASGADWDLLRSLGRNSPSAVEKNLYFKALGDATDTALAQKTLALALTAEPGATNGAPMIAAVAALHPEAAFDFARANEARVGTLLDDYSRSDFIPGLLATSSDAASVSRLESLRAERPETARKEADEQLAGLRQRLVAGPRSNAQVAAWLNASGRR